MNDSAACGGALRAVAAPCVGLPSPERRCAESPRKGTGCVEPVPCRSRLREMRRRRQQLLLRLCFCLRALGCQIESVEAFVLESGLVDVTNVML